MLVADYVVNQDVVAMLKVDQGRVFVEESDERQVFIPAVIFSIVEFEDVLDEGPVTNWEFNMIKSLVGCVQKPDVSIRLETTFFKAMPVSHLHFQQVHRAHLNDYIVEFDYAGV